LATGRRDTTGASSCDGRGLVVGGQVGGGYTSDTDLITFSNNTANGSFGALSGTAASRMGVSATGVAVFSGGGLGGNFFSTDSDKVDFDAGTANGNFGALGTGRYDGAGTGYQV